MISTQRGRTTTSTHWEFFLKLISSLITLHTDKIFVMQVPLLPSPPLPSLLANQVDPNEVTVKATTQKHFRAELSPQYTCMPMQCACVDWRFLIIDYTVYYLMVIYSTK